jgi:hypothetical protein
LSFTKSIVLYSPTFLSHFHKLQCFLSNGTKNMHILASGPARFGYWFYTIFFFIKGSNNSEPHYVGRFSYIPKCWANSQSYCSWLPWEVELYQHICFYSAQKSYAIITSKITLIWRYVEPLFEVCTYRERLGEWTIIVFYIFPYHATHLYQ